MNYVYFVSYVSVNGTSLTFGCIEINLGDKIKDFTQIQDIATAIDSKNSVKSSVISYQLLREEPKR